MADAAPLFVEREIRIAARPEIVFEHFVDAERLARWIGPASEVDARPGGALRLAVSGAHPVSGRFVEIDPPRRLVFTWGWDRPEYEIPPGSTRVEIDLTADGEATILRLRHHGLPGDPNENAQGWIPYLDRLAIVASGGDPGLDPLAPATTNADAQATP